MYTLSELLSREGFTITKSSNKANKVLRFLDMCKAVLVYQRRVDYVLIDTFSTLNFYYAFVVSQLCRLLKKKYITILHGGNLPNRLENSKTLSNLIFNNSYRNVAPSMYLKTHFDKKRYKTVYIPNTIEIEHYTYKERKEISTNILWVRAFDAIYNPQMAIEIVRILKEKYPQVALCMVGPIKDNSFSICKDLVKKYSLEASVTFTGVLKKEEWHELSRDYDVFINTTNIDNTPVSVIEAMALGLPVVSTNVGGIPFLIKDQIDGVLVNKDNPVSMAKAVADVFEEKHMTLAKNARKKVEAYDWSSVKEKWKTILI
jgi:glycosyltransferase involved in cell wall biosynthesis